MDRRRKPLEVAQRTGPRHESRRVEGIWQIRLAGAQFAARTIRQMSELLAPYPEAKAAISALIYRRLQEMRAAGERGN
jgi:hypothetical protein